MSIYQYEDGYRVRFPGKRTPAPGIYATREAAQFAHRFQHGDLALLAREILFKKKRYITMDDLRAAIFGLDMQTRRVV